LGQPSGNATGVSYFSYELGPKRLQLLRETVPHATTIAYLVNPTNPNLELGVRNIEAAAHSVGQQIIFLNASTADDIDAAFTEIVKQHAGALLVGGDSIFFSQLDQIVTLAARYGIPASYFAREFVVAGGLMSYSDDRAESIRQAGVYAGRILKGEKPSDLPVIQPSKFDFAVNLKTAKALGLTIPETLLATADEVIQ
jgi:putative ABC transport system substrate-binding protein